MIHLSIDIPYEELIKAMEAINCKKGICKILPQARFRLSHKSTDFKFECLVCDPKMGGHQTGIAAGYCVNCVIKNYT